MLRKMLLEYIVRSAEVEEFEKELANHQRATVEGGGTVLERAVREHNVGACGKVGENSVEYNFDRFRYRYTTILALTLSALYSI